MTTKIAEQRELIKKLNEYCWDRFLVGVNELWRDFPVEEDEEDADILADTEFQSDFENHFKKRNLFCALAWRAYKWDLDDMEPQKNYEEIYGYDNDPFYGE